jgi:DNA polymerase
MPVWGSGKRRILFVGEAPGADEDSQGRPFVGKAGRFLREKLDELGCDLDECRVTNSIICHPPENKMDQRYADACAPSLAKVLREETFNVIITLGEWALRQVIPDDYLRYGGPLGRWTGWAIPLPYGTWLCPVYHPSYLVRSGENVMMVKAFVDDLANALNHDDSRPEVHDLEDLKSRVELVRKPRARLDDLSSRSGILAFDYETTGLKPDAPGQRVVSCSFCLDGEDTWAFEMGDEFIPRLGKILFSKRLKKVASNLKFEERWTLKMFGRGVIGWHWDTMLAAHVLDNRSGITSIKFQSFVRLGVGGWEDGVAKYLKAEDANSLNKVHLISRDDLLIYNGLDSLLEFKVMELQKEEMGCRGF